MTTQTDAIMALADRYAFHIPGSQHSDEARAALLAALQEQASSQPASIKTWQQRLEEACPALGPLHIHACVEEVNDAMQAEIDDLRSALQEQAPEADCATTGVCVRSGLYAAPVQAREGEAVVPSAILARGRFHFFKGEDGEPDDWEWFEEGTNCEHGCIDAVIVRADALSAPQPAQPLPLTDEQINLMVHSKHFDPSYELKASDKVCINWYRQGLRDAEAAHGIGGAR